MQEYVSAYYMGDNSKRKGELTHETTRLSVRSNEEYEDLCRPK